MEIGKGKRKGKIMTNTRRTNSKKDTTNQTKNKWNIICAIKLHHLRVKIGNNEPSEYS